VREPFKAGDRVRYTSTRCPWTRKGDRGTVKRVYSQVLFSVEWDRSEWHLPNGTLLVLKPDTRKGWDMVTPGEVEKVKA
jgi:hypothetical protein